MARLRSWWKGHSGAIAEGALAPVWGMGRRG